VPALAGDSGPKQATTATTKHLQLLRMRDIVVCLLAETNEAAPLVRRMNGQGGAQRVLCSRAPREVNASSCDFLKILQ
jgi:hypothetical protein